MRVFLKCSDGNHGYVLAEVDPDLHLVVGILPLQCPVRGCKGVLKRWKRASKAATYVSARELYLQAMGRGSYEERKCDSDMLEKAMIGESIVAMDLQNLLGKNRTIISSLTLKNGTVVHFATSTLGATIYKVTKEPK